MARTIAYVQEHGYDSYEKLSETAEAIYTKMAKARGDAKLTESKLRKTNEQIHYLGQYLSTKSIYGEFLKAPNKKIFRQAHSDELAQYEEALQILKQHSPGGKFPTMKDLRAEKEQLTIQKDAQYDTYHYFKDYYKELQTVCANIDRLLTDGQCRMMINGIQFIQALLEANELAVGKDHQFKGRYEAEKNAVIISLEKDEREW